MGIVELIQCIAVSGLCFERLITKIQKSRCVTIKSKCCCFDLLLKRKLNNDDQESSPDNHSSNGEEPKISTNTV